MKKHTKPLMKVPGIILASLLGIVLVLFLVLWAWSPGKIDPYLDEEGHVPEGSVSEILRLEIGGMEQGMILKGKSGQNPVLLFLHGGPGNPEYVMAKESSVGLEDAFTVCWWEQRGGGMSYSPSIPAESMTLEQMVSDTVEVTNYLRGRFGVDKIYLAGHSWGSFLGVHTVSQYPELYAAFIGIGQVTDQLESEKLGYDHMLGTAKAQGDKKSLDKLAKYTLAGPESITTEYLMLRSSILGKQGNGVYHIPRSALSLLLSVLRAKEYTLSDIYGYAMGSLLSLKSPANEAVMATNLRETLTEVDVPVYICHGAYDRQVSYALAKEYFELLEAPEKRFYTFERSAHSPFLEEPEEFMRIIREDVLP